MRMILRDTIIQIKGIKEKDGFGGFSRKDEQRTEIECKASLNTSPEVATAYGPAGEQILYVVTRVPLDKEAVFLFNDKKYNIRFSTQTNRLYYSTLVEIKRG